MANTLRPETEEQATRVVAWAAAERKPLEVVGGGSKREIGRPFQAETTLDLSALSGISLYEPAELVLSAGAGTPITDIETALAEHGQELAFEPPQLGDFFGQAKSTATLGGTLASNLSGPRRIKAGAARDHFLGLRGVTGRAEAIKAGGRVMKNVTGYDLCKGIAGSWGTLAVLTEVTVKVLPAAETCETLIVFGLDMDEAVMMMSAGLGAPVDVSGAAHVPEALVRHSHVKAVADNGKSVTALRLEGFEASVAARAETLKAELRSYGDLEHLSGNQAKALWRDIRDVRLLPKGDDHVVWRVSTAPTQAPDLVRAVSEQDQTNAVFDWGGGLVWLTHPSYGDGGAESIRAALRRLGGHATLVRATPGTRTAVSVFEPQPEALASLTRRMKAAFDPHGILNPGRMYAGV